MRSLVLRPLIASFGICAFAWGIAAIRIYSVDAAFADTARAVLSGNRFNDRQLISIKRQLDTAQDDLVEASALRGAAVLRTVMLEGQLKDGTRELSYADYDQLRANVHAAIAQSPTESFMWLIAFWVTRLRGEVAPKDSNLLRMSYRAGPNEGWIAVRRNPLTLPLLGPMYDEFSDQALSEFAGLVRSGFYWDAAGIFERATTPVRNQLLHRLTTVEVTDRHAFARALKSKDIDGVVLPGVD